MSVADLRPDIFTWDLKHTKQEFRPVGVDFRWQLFVIIFGEEMSGRNFAQCSLIYLPPVTSEND